MLPDENHNSKQSQSYVNFVINDAKPAPLC